METADLWVTPAWLRERLGDPGVVLLDCRFALDDPSKGWREYQERHIPGARYAHLDRDLSAPAGEHGGRHPLPAAAAFARFAARACIGPDTHVVAYDEGGEMAARCWWVFQYFGHGRVSALYGGIGAWQRAGHDCERDIPPDCPEEAGLFAPRPEADMLAEREDILRRTAAGGAGFHLVDVRAPERYRGDVEPLDPRAGHIPGAVNYFWRDALQGAAKPRDPADLRAHFQALRDGREVVVYCGSGVTASAGVMALRSAGVSARLYAGSWSDWCSYADSPVATGAAP